MKSSVIKLVYYYCLFLVIFVLQKPLFMLFNGDVYAHAGFGDYISVISHGRPHDMALAGYLSIIPGLLIIAAQWMRGGWIRLAHIIYALIVSVVMSVIFVVDTGLYGYWGTKLDTTPLFYFFSSPEAAAASVSGWFILGAVIIMVLFAAVYFWLLYRYPIRVNVEQAANVVSRLKRTGVILLLLGLCFVSIRGGFTVATMNISAVYYSPDIKLNHAAVNPAFSFMYAATHESDFSGQYNFFYEKEAHERFGRLMEAENCPDSLEIILNNRRPDIYMVILESFSAHLMPSLGGESIAVGLDSVAGKGLLFSNFYASSFRTDRAIPAILSGYPAQPSTSIMKYAPKTETLPSIASALGNVGYDCSYYYGGDANFTNMKAYLMSTGFSRIISDRDFPMTDRMSKWGVVDHKVIERCAADNGSRRYDSAHPRFVVIQTSSSHEPFDVPYDNPRMTVPAANAFAYTDSCVTAFINGLAVSPDWDNTLVILVPDHQGGYPRNLENESRFHIPLIMTGGALNRKGGVLTPASQADLAATLLAQLGVDHSGFKFSKNIFDPSVKPFAEFSNASMIGWITPVDTIIYSLADDRVIKARPDSASRSLDDAKAFLQVLYDDLDRR